MLLALLSMKKRKKRKMESFRGSSGGGGKRKNGCGCHNDGGDRWFPINNNMKPPPPPPPRSKESGEGSLRRYPKYAADAKMKGVVDASSSWSLKPISVMDTRHSLRVAGGSSYEICVICEDAKPFGVMRRGSHCGHRYCDACVEAHVRGKVKEDIHSIKCPEKDCNKTLDMGFCRDSLGDSNYALLDAWADAEREAKVLGDPFRIKCPFLDCSRTFVDDGKKYLIRACPNCWRIFCMRCKVRWHMGMSCWQYEITKKVKNFLSRLYGEDDEIKEFAGLYILPFD